VTARYRGRHASKQDRRRPHRPPGGSLPGRSPVLGGRHRWTATGQPPPDNPYEHLAALGGDVSLALQRTGTGTPSRVHLDIETDDVPAEPARLLGLGARVVIEHEEYRIMADPGGLVFCIVPVQTDDFAERAQLWP
jgi:hypothetical protein